MRKWRDLLHKFRKFNTLRNQIIVGFTLTMSLVLTFADAFIYGEVSVLLKESAERHIQQTAIQANGRLDALLEQVDSLTSQAATDPYVQTMLSGEAEGRRANFQERQALLQKFNNYISYSPGIRSFELYTIENKRLFPLDDSSIHRLPEEALAAADEKKGRIAWIGIDPTEPESVVAVRRIHLLDRSYQPGGYLLVHVKQAYFEMNGAEGDGHALEETEIMVLSDGYGNPISSGLDDSVTRSVLAQSGSIVTIGEQRMLAVRERSEETGWNFLLLMPEAAATEGLSVLRAVINVSIGISALAFLVLTLVLSIMITRPIQRLRKSMTNVKLGGLRLIPAGRTGFRALEISELNNTYNQMVTHMNELIQVVYEKELTLSRTELKALQAQINPHFLFNTLEAFYWSLEEKDESELAQTIVAMSGLFRYVIGSASGNDEWVTIRDELEHAQRYLQIMKMRLGDRLHWRIDADERLLHAPIPKLLIQPLVENAILHGVESRIGPGTVTIRVKSTEPGVASIDVIDDGNGMDEEALDKLMRRIENDVPQPSGKGAGVAMANVQRRLKLYFPDMEPGGGRLRIESELGVGTKVGFDISNPREEEERREDDHDR